MRHSRHRDALEQQVESIMAPANRWCLIWALAYAAAFALFCWYLS